MTRRRKHRGGSTRSIDEKHEKSPRKKKVTNTHRDDPDCPLLNVSNDSADERSNSGGSGQNVETGTVAPNGRCNEVQQSDVHHSQLESENVAPFSANELETLLGRIDVIPKTAHDHILLRVLESIIAEVEFHNPDFHDLYVYFVRRLAISSTKTCTSAYVALMRCLARGDMTNLVDSLLISLTRSLRRALIDPLTIEDMKLLADSVLEPKSLSLVGKLVTENQMAGISRAHTGRTNFDKATLAIEAAGYAFADLGELLEHVDRIVVDHPGCVKQVRMMLYSIFTRHQQLLETHARAIAYATQRVSYCPVEALPIIASMLRSSIEMGLATPTSKGYYGMALIFLANLDLENANVEQLLEAISLLGDICKLAPSALKDVLETFTSLSEHVSSCDNERKDVVVQAILDASLQFVENTNDYGPQLELVAFFEALEKQRIFLPKKACGILIAKASGLSLINRVCGILLRQEEENNEDVDEEMVTNVKERIWQWYPLGKEKKKRTQVQDVIRLEQPNVYSYITSRHTSGEAPIVL